MAEARSTILIVDDDADDLAAVAQALGSLQAEIVTLRDPHDVLPTVRKLAPEVLVLDALLPGLSGFDLCLEIKSDPELRATSVVILTAVYLRQQYRKEALTQFKADAFLTKPFRPPELQRLVGHLLTRKSPGRLLSRLGRPSKPAKRSLLGRLFGRGGESPEDTRLTPPRPERRATAGETESSPNEAKKAKPPAIATNDGEAAPASETEPVDGKVGRAPIVLPPPEPGVVESDAAQEPEAEVREPEALEADPKPEGAEEVQEVEELGSPGGPEPLPTLEADAVVAPEEPRRQAEVVSEAATESEPTLRAAEPAPEPLVVSETEPEARSENETDASVDAEPDEPDEPGKEEDAASSERAEAEEARADSESDEEVSVAEAIAQEALAARARAAEEDVDEVEQAVADVEGATGDDEPEQPEEEEDEPSAAEALEAAPGATREAMSREPAKTLPAVELPESLRGRSAPAESEAAATPDAPPAEDEEDAVAEAPEGDVEDEMPASLEAEEVALPPSKLEPEAPSANRRRRPYRRRAGEAPVFDEEDFDAELRRELSKCRRVNRPLTLILIQVEDLDQIVELFGKEFREDVLWHVADQAMASLREVDVVGMIASKDRVAMTAFASDRYGGGRIVARMKRTVGKHPIHVGEELPPIVPALAFGMASYPEDADDAEMLVSRAEEDLRAAKAHRED